MRARETSDVGAANHEMIVLARESRGLTQSELAERIPMSQGLLSKVERGAVAASTANIEALAMALDYPEHFFFQRERICGPSTSEFFHRKRADVSAKLLARIHAHVNIRRIQISRLMKAADVPISIPRIDPDEFGGDIEEISRALRARWQTPRGPLKDLVATIESAGAFVLRMRFDSSKVDAVSWWTGGEHPIFVVNDAMPADRERMTIAHELGHLVMHSVANPEMEEQANRFAAAFLMPAEDIRAALRTPSLASLAALKPYWRVSINALLKRAEDVKAVTPEKARYLWSQLARAGYRTREPAELDFPKEPATLLQELIDTHTNELGYELHELAHVLAWNDHEVLANHAVRGHSEAPKTKLRVVK